ncbi:NAD(P)-binding protein [Lentithecium fluviatile CBS 122367]|uniref:NAD(P)-binding protein n=1 Tax=Lentithecium fluviatile CBS 122367 TaxID=1168545 RepID=A0A6G1IF22_9PLEO|nr:NAD(P)-binding protein [Lentithecium fluviatile CBS 122367]
MQSVLHKVNGPKKIHPKNLNGRVAVVTGGTLGIGYEVTRSLALAGVKVIMVNRKEEQGNDAIEKIKQEGGEAEVDVSWTHCDMGNLKEVQEVFSGSRKELDRLEFHVLSVGINTNQYGQKSDGIDRHFGVNWLDQFYMSKLDASPKPRVVFLSSEMQRTAPSNYGLRGRVIKPNGHKIYTASWKDAYPGILGKILSSAMLLIAENPEQGSYRTTRQRDALGAALWGLSERLVKEKLGDAALINWNQE